MAASFLAALPSTLGFEAGLEAPLPPPLPSMRKLILSCHCALSSSLLVNALVAQPLGSRELVLGSWVVIRSQAVREEAAFIGLWGPLLAFVLTHVLLQKNTQSEGKISDGFL